MEKGYILTNFGRIHNYLGLIPRQKIDDVLRETFLVLRNEDMPLSVRYISICTEYPESYVKRALDKLIEVELVRKIE